MSFNTDNQGYQRKKKNNLRKIVKVECKFCSKFFYKPVHQHKRDSCFEFECETKKRIEVLAERNRKVRERNAKKGRP